MPLFLVLLYKFRLSRLLATHLPRLPGDDDVIVMASSSPASSLLPSPFPSSSPAADETIHSRLEESERSRKWWKQRVSVLDLRCREINAHLRETLTENKRYTFISPYYCSSICLEYSDFVRLKEENERLAAELHVYRMRMIAEQTLRKIDSSITTTALATPPPTPDHNNTPYASPFFPHHHPLTPSPTPPQTPTSPRSPSMSSSRIPLRWSPMQQW